MVGVGSVGTRAWVLLLEADGGREPLFLQAKEAQRSVLADYCGASKHRNEGQRVVAGQHLMQAASDIFLGWQHVDAGLDGQSRDFYVRQLRDWKYSAAIEHDGALRPRRSTPSCAAGPSPARTPARATGSRSRATSASPTSSTGPWSRYAEAYADRNEADHAALAQAVTDGRIEAVTGI